MHAEEWLIYTIQMEKRHMLSRIYKTWSNSPTKISLRLWDRNVSLLQLLELFLIFPHSLERVNVGYLYSYYLDSSIGRYRGKILPLGPALTSLCFQRAASAAQPYAIYAPIQMRRYRAKKLHQKYLFLFKGGLSQFLLFALNQFQNRPIRLSLVPRLPQTFCRQP